MDLITVNIKTVDGKTIPILCTKSETVLTLKKRIGENSGIMVEESALVFGSKVMVNDNQLNSYKIEDQSILFFTRRFIGGIEFCTNI